MSRVSKKVALVMAVSIFMGASVAPCKADVVASLDTAEEVFFGTTSADSVSDKFFDNSNQNGASAPDPAPTPDPIPKQDSSTNTNTSVTTPAQDNQTPSTTLPSNVTETTNSNNVYYYYYTTPTTAPASSSTSSETVTDKSEKITLNGTSQEKENQIVTNVTLKQPQIATVVGGKREAVVAIKRAVTGADGYHIQISKSKNFKNTRALRTVLTTKSVRVKGSDKHYVRVRAYQVVNGKYVYSAWSPVKSVKIKK